MDSSVPCTSAFASDQNVAISCTCTPRPISTRRRHDNTGLLRAAKCSYWRMVAATLVLAAFISGASAQFTTQPQEQPYHLTAGSSRLLQCSVLDKYADPTLYTLQWVKSVGGSPRVISSNGNVRQPENYELRRSSSKGAYDLFINSVSYENDNGRFFCQVEGTDGTFEESRPAVVVVLVPPEGPEISNQPGSPVREGDLVQTACHSQGGNPPPTIQWKFNNGTTVPEDWVQVRNATSLQERTESVLRWRVSAEDNDKRLVCSVYNVAMGQGEPLTMETGKLTVLFPPKVTVGPVDVYNVEKGHNAQLFCNAVANPPVGAPSFDWRNEKTGRQWPARQNLILTAEKELDGNYTCTASNSQGSGRATLQMNVLYEPQVIVEPEYRVAEGEELVLRCQVDANPSVVSVEWRGPLNNPTLSSDTSELRIPRVSRTDRGNYTCTATNTLSLFEIGSVPRTGKGSTSVLVMYSPGQAKISVASPVLVGDTAKLSCRAEETGYPSARFRWKSPGAVSYEANDRTDYVIDNVQLTHAGEYYCLPFNDAGEGEEGMFLLQVLQPARIEQFNTDDVERDEGDGSLQWTCVGSGLPAPNITWLKDGKPIESGGHWRIDQSTDRGYCNRPEKCSVRVLGTLDWVDGVKWDDKGTYTCQAYNGAGDMQQDTKTLRVRHQPHIVNDRTQVLTAANVGQPTSISCHASALPRPSFKWYYKGEEIGEGNVRYTEREQMNETASVYTSILTIVNVMRDDFGDATYACQAVNNLGQSQKRAFAIRERSKPMPPSDLRRLNGGPNWLAMGWEPGFDGGFEQMFNLAMRTHNALTDEPSSSVTLQSRKKRAALPAPEPEMRNVTSLQPQTAYSFRIQASNRLGKTAWSDWVEAVTEDWPVDLNFPSEMQPKDAKYNADAGTIDFKPSIDPTLYCLMIYVKMNEDWRRYDCVKVGSQATDIPNQSMQVRFCSSASPPSCSRKVDVTVVASASGAWNDFLIPLIVAVTAIFAVAAVVLLCCCMKRNRSPKKPAAPRTKDYEMESNQARPKAISAPYIERAEKAPNTDVHGSQADSGVFTMGSQYRVASFDPNAGYDDMGYTNDAYAANGGLRSSYDDDRWGNAGDPYGDVIPGDPYLSNGYQTDYPEMGYQPQRYDGYYDPYGNPAGMVDLNPVGTPYAEDDGSSEFSTPSSRRVMREIIV